MSAAMGVIVFAGFAAVVLFLLVSGSRRYDALVPANDPTFDPAIQIARERLARGEIDVEHYARTVALLTGAHLPPTPA